MVRQCYNPFSKAFIAIILALVIILPAGVSAQPLQPMDQQTLIGDDPVPLAPDVCDFFDDFDNNDFGWATIISGRYNIRVEGGLYKWTLVDGAAVFSTYGFIECSNFHLVVDATVVSNGGTMYPGPDYYALDFANYEFRVQNNGEYNLIKSPLGEEIIVLSGALPSWYNPGLATNHPFVNVYNDQIVIGINDYAFDVYYAPVNAPGGQGLGMSGWTDQPHEVHFDNFTQTASSPYTFLYLPLINK